MRVREMPPSHEKKAVMDGWDCGRQRGTNLQKRWLAWLGNGRCVACLGNRGGDDAPLPTRRPAAPCAWRVGTGRSGARPSGSVAYRRVARRGSGARRRLTEALRAVY